MRDHRSQTCTNDRRGLSRVAGWARRCRISVISVGIVVWPDATALALPPLGLTLIDPQGVFGGHVTIVGDQAFARAGDGIWVVDEGGSELTVFSHPDYNVIPFPTPVVQGTDGRLYVGATLFLEDGDNVIALYNLEFPDLPLETWTQPNEPPFLADGMDIQGIDRHQRGYGGLDLGDDKPVRYLPGGTIVASEGIQGGPADVAESGYSVGQAAIPNTAGVGAAMWDPAGNATYFELQGRSVGLGRSIADRADGNGLNFGFRSATVILADGPPVVLRDLQGNRLRGIVQVSQSDFSILGPFFLDEGEFYGYYPGIVPGMPDAALPLVEVFPELATIEFSSVGKPYAIDGHVYMVLGTTQGTMLFGARDPSLIPEPATLALMLVTAASLVPRRRSRVR